MFRFAPRQLLALAISWTACLARHTHRANESYNDGIHLAVSPKCGFLSGRTADVNAGLNPRNFKTIVAFGIELLASPPTNARNFMVLDVYGRGTTAPSGEKFKQTVFSGLNQFHTRTNDTQLNVSYVNFANIWDGVIGPVPGYAAFGYTNTSACTQCTDQYGCSTIDMCSDPDHYFQWLPG
ncbi:hypothetical protein C0991_002645 [Blastosporella zonata]|nr:hypothetical protein C0991_002645 [Blastosporella zonata]